MVLLLSKTSLQLCLVLSASLNNAFRSILLSFRCHSNNNVHFKNNMYLTVIEANHLILNLNLSDHFISRFHRNTPFKPIASIYIYILVLGWFTLCCHSVKYLLRIKTVKPHTHTHTHTHTFIVQCVISYVSIHVCICLSVCLSIYISSNESIN